jgi:DNA repair protein RadB
MAQVATHDFTELAPQIILMKPQNFAQQTFVVDRLAEYVGDRVGLIIIDTATRFYREELGDNIKKTLRLNRELNRQMATIAQITRTRKVVSLIISQVRGVVYRADETIQPVAMRVMKFWADLSVSLWPTRQHDRVRVDVETPKKKRAKPIHLRITKEGLQDDTE